MVIFTLSAIAFFIFISYQLIINTSKIIDFLKLDSGFDEHEFSFEEKEKKSINISGRQALIIALIIISVVVLIDQVPQLFSNIYFYFQVTKMGYKGNSVDSRSFIIPITKIVIALLILGERKRIIDFVERKNYSTKNRLKKQNE